MRMLVKANFPAEKGSEAYQSGAMQRVFQAAAEALKPEAMYFYPEDGQRTAFIVFDMEGSWQLPAIVEPMFRELGASVHVTPVMTGEDLERGMKEAAA
jgi:poly(3-hydroxybutyrate) depolymerase